MTSCTNDGRGRQGHLRYEHSDFDDDKFIDAALSSGASIVVSGDRHLLTLEAVEGLEILTARQFLDRLATGSPESPVGPSIQPS
jgi:hypothetical protein